MPYRVPLTLVEHWPAKLTLAVSLAAVSAFLDAVSGLYGRLFMADPLLVLVIVTLMVVDSVTGVAAALKRHEKLRSKAFRRTGWKVLEYTALGIVGVMLSNAFHPTVFHLLTDSLDEAILLYVAVGEAFSIVENVTGGREQALRLIRRVRTIARSPGEITLEEVVRPLTEAEAEATQLDTPAPPIDPSVPTQPTP